jgi:hypothetical protein
MEAESFHVDRQTKEWRQIHDVVDSRSRKGTRILLQRQYTRYNHVIK